MGYYDSVPSLKGSELWAPVLKVVYHGVIMALYGFRIGGRYVCGQPCVL